MSLTQTIQSPKVGEINFSEEDIFHLESGMLGFEDEKSFLLVRSEKVEPFLWFQSVKTESLAFLLCDPRTLIPSYQVKLHKTELSEIELEDGEESFVYVILSVPDDPSQMTANLKGPLVLNLSKKKAQQMILESEELRHPVFSSAPA